MIIKKDINKKMNLHSEYQIRKKKLINLLTTGFNFPNQFKPNTTLKQINKKYLNYTRKELFKIHINIKIAGRIIKKRIMGKAAFIIIKEMNSEIQIYVTEQKISSDFYQHQFKTWDIGDIIAIIGKIFKTKTGQLSVYCEQTILLVKSLRPLPEKFHGLTDQEIRYRKRYLDLLSNKNSMENFIKRSKILKIIRNFMHLKKFIEVETPMMQNVPGGATARPFITNHNTLDIQMYLRISPELYLKKLIIGGFTKIYEINRNFRNEGISYKHNPEFTMMEMYIAYADHNDLMQFIIIFLQHIVHQLTGKNIIQYQEHILNINTPFQKLTIQEAIVCYNPSIYIDDLKNIQKIKKIAQLYNIPIQENWNINKIIMKIFENTTENKLIQPTFITEYPTEISPLARRNDKNKKISERFEFFMGGIEIGNGFSELNNPNDQKKRFLKQYNEQKKIKNNISLYDAEYVEALEYGMPPTAGLGIGIDRLIMLLTNQNNIRDVILFPTLRPIK
ncbi:lysine--tRNA ligase [Buchnera aphidicola]|uniref:Lysine--tRNA ligase n=1 Tax=Buchnera aphidicola (Sarucallis kahawaluokalani) TaxID=1241878 RepID=A0A4D6YD95_9GAMM|nr:lysine--tRNA ligase [Buchnera aphidicola]QCI26073.1 lysine--tRNA ligase [Buchnera aphidicola (Sarucallis kahawaluokalani)]